MHLPMPDRSVDEPPPTVVGVVGPPGVGKTTLIQSLVKHYTRHKINETKGPITVVTGKNRRLTIVECPNEVNAMLDVAKVADLILLMVDASFGFEMETFEFLNILQTHGFPKVMGVLTNLDKFKDGKRQKRTKKRLKHRFWTEIYQGAKLFYLSGLINGSYPKHEIHNLSRFISVMKFRPLQWRVNHPYVLADRFEDVTEAEAKRRDPKCDRRVLLYGYVRGTHFKSAHKVHIPGVGDFFPKDVAVLSDPCPAPQKAAGEKRKSLKQQDKSLYAPMGDIASIMYDKDAVYINIPQHQLAFTRQTSEEGQETEPAGPGEAMVRELQDAKVTMDEKLNASGLRLFSASAKTLSAQDVTERAAGGKERTRRRVMFGDEDNEEGGDGDSEEDDDDEEGDEMGEEGDSDAEEADDGEGGMSDGDDDLDGEEGDEAEARSGSRGEKLEFEDDEEEEEGDAQAGRSRGGSGSGAHRSAIEAMGDDDGIDDEVDEDSDSETRA